MSLNDSGLIQYFLLNPVRTTNLMNVLDRVWEHVYSRGKFVLKASHWFRNVHWDIVVVKSYRTTNNIKFYKIVFNVTLLMQGIKSFIFQPHFHARRSRDL